MRTCENCKYSEPMVGALACMGQKGMPYVRPTDSCDSWKTVKQTNADRLRQMSDEELADLLTAVAKKSAKMLCKSLKTVEVDLSKCDFETLTKAHLSWLKAPVEEGDNG